MESFAIFLFYPGCIFFLICVHETGHYLAGRLGGISSDNMRIRLFRFPQHVMLRHDDKWIAPTTDVDTYVKLVWLYLKTTSRVYFYVAGGIALETFAVVVASAILILTGLPKSALAIVAMSSCLLLPWLIIDTIMVARGRVFGDFSGLWRLAPLPTAMIIFAMIAVRVALAWWASVSI